MASSTGGGVSEVEGGGAATLLSPTAWLTVGGEMCSSAPATYFCEVFGVNRLNRASSPAGAFIRC